MNRALNAALFTGLGVLLGVVLGARAAVSTPNPDLAKEEAIEAKIQALGQRIQGCEQKFTRITVLFEPPQFTVDANGLPITLGSSALGSVPAWMIPAEVSPRRIVSSGPLSGAASNASLDGYRYEILDFAGGQNHVIFGPAQAALAQPGERFRLGQPLAP